MTLSEELAKETLRELDRATRQYGEFTTYHHGYAVILEELDELWDEIKHKQPDPDVLHREAIQVAAMALRFVMDLCHIETIEV